MPEVSLTPLIDTALTLLIIFMITAPMMQNAIKVTLPKGQAKEVDDHIKKCVVSLDKDGKIYFGDGSTPMELDQVVASIQRRVGSRSDETVFVEADKLVTYEKVIDVVDKIKVVGGVKYVALATKG